MSGSPLTGGRRRRRWRAGARRRAPVLTLIGLLAIAFVLTRGDWVRFLVIAVVVIAAILYVHADLERDRVGR